MIIPRSLLEYELIVLIRDSKFISNNTRILGEFSSRKHRRPLTLVIIRFRELSNSRMSGFWKVYITVLSLCKINKVGYD